MIIDLYVKCLMSGRLVCGVFLFLFFLILLHELLDYLPVTLYRLASEIGALVAKIEILLNSILMLFQTTHIEAELVSRTLLTILSCFHCSTFNNSFITIRS